MSITSISIESPLGVLHAVLEDNTLVRLDFQSGAVVNHSPQIAEQKIAKKILQECAEYFAGTRQTFTVPYHIQGTPFQAAVWKALVEIPYGSTVSYSDIAARIGRPTAVRAVGQAIHHNPIAIIIPCHRVIGKNRTLTGYAGGLPTKAWLLAHEQRHANAHISKGEK